MRDYKCEMCGVVYQTEEPVEQTIQEMKENFGDIPEEERAVVCDRCFKAITIDSKPINFN